MGRVSSAITGRGGQRVQQSECETGGEAQGALLL